MKREYDLLKGIAIELSSKKERKHLNELSTIIRRLKFIRSNESSEIKRIH